MRGVSAGNLIIVDEAAYTDNRLWLETIIPLVTMKDTIIICISTPSKDKHNFFHHMMTVTHPGTDRKVFGTIEFDLYCDECRKRRRPTCRHRQDLQPKWKGKKKFEISEILYGEVYQSYHLRETMGVVTDENNQMFRSTWISFLENRNHWVRNTKDVKPSHIYLSIDPNAGGTSMMSIVSFSIIQGSYLVC